MRIQSVTGIKDNILGGHCTGHFKQKMYMHIHVSYSERFPSYSYFTVGNAVNCTDEQHAMSSAPVAKCIDVDGGIFGNVLY
jgi:hypothetical protein